MRVYINYIILYSFSKEQHIKNLDKVLKKLNKANFKLNMKKCSFIEPEVIVLRHLVNTAGIHLNFRKIQEI